MNKREVLIVDDDIVFLKLVLSIIKQEGIKAHYARNGKEAVGILQKRRFTTLITDLQMPGMGGYELAKIAKELDSDIDIVMIADGMSSEILCLAALTDVSKVLVKPVSAVQIRQLIRD
ncbi:MAG: response regulator [Geobacteraceae bacterium]|nr:response regulator [Geobacteraceae bacterium]